MFQQGLCGIIGRRSLLPTMPLLSVFLLLAVLASSCRAVEIDYTCPEECQCYTLGFDVLDQVCGYDVGCLLVT